MRISLDYYQILGVTPSVSPEQLDRAYQDARQSIPHREFSDLALESRNRLLQEALVALSSPPLPEGEIPAMAEVEIPESDRVGAYILLYGLGLYEEVISLSDTSGLEESALLNSDRALVVALSRQAQALELWQQGNYIEAGEILEAAQEHLMAQSLFLHLRGEIQSYLSKLRPHRVFALIAHDHPEMHAQGLLLLKEMLAERQGIDGLGNDYSGLDMDQFLRFIQQIRHHLTTLEQQQLFEEEAKRPSPVAAYLTAYALTARGFAERRPDFIRRAKGVLVKLSSNQNVHLECALCALLLGQTEESLTEIVHSKEYPEILALQPDPTEPPDLLLNLCLYCEGWLAKEVYPHFSDLAGKIPSLKEYFAEEQVESYLEDLPTMSASEWVVSALPRPVIPSPPLWTPPTFTPPSLDMMDKQPTSGEPTPPSTPPQEPSPGRSLGIVLRILIGTIVGLTAGAGVWLWRQRVQGGSPSNAPLVLIQRPLFRAMGQTTSLRVAEEMNTLLAAQIITSWQNAKSVALGSTYEVKALDAILVDPVLSEWRSRVEQYKKEGSHLQYTTKGVEVKKVIPDGKDKADVVAIISEDRDFILQGERQANYSRSGAQYEVTYKLLRRDDTWVIQDIIVVE